jgi:hypothetical protein
MDTFTVNQNRVNSCPQNPSNIFQAVFVLPQTQKTAALSQQKAERTLIKHHQHEVPKTKHP